MTPAQRLNASMSKAHKRMSRMVGLCLLLAKGQDLEPLQGLIAVARLSLTPWERRSLAWAMCMACDDAEVAEIAGRILPVMAGPPEAPFDPSDVAADAEFWADHAEPLEHRFYAMAILSRMTPAERRQLLGYMDGRGL